MTIDLKWDQLKSLLGEMRLAVIAYSGGVDSSLLLKAASEALGPHVIAVTAVSPTYPRDELAAAGTFARTLGITHKIIHTDELASDAFAGNTAERCYHCKRELFIRLREIADAEGITFLLDGTNADDAMDYRPGSRAAREFSVRSPLKEAGLTKQEIRDLARSMHLPMWDKPSLACLASRIPYGTKITEEILSMIQRAEDRLRMLGFRQVRVRHHGNSLARIEVERSALGRMLSDGVIDEVTAALKEIGYTYVCLDLEGYRTGSMNEVLEKQETADSRQ